VGGHSEGFPVCIYALELYIFAIQSEKKMKNGSSDSFYGNWMTPVWIAVRNKD